MLSPKPVSHMRAMLIRALLDPRVGPRSSRPRAKRRRAGAAPYESDLQRLSEILGALHYLRDICGAREGQAWRNEMQALVDAEAPSGERRERLIAAFNRGYRGFQQTFRSCTPAARLRHPPLSRRRLENRARHHRALCELNCPGCGNRH